jgi:hypothetical protein
MGCRAKVPPADLGRHWSIGQAYCLLPGLPRSCVTHVSGPDRLCLVPAAGLEPATYRLQADFDPVSGRLKRLYEVPQIL